MGDERAERANLAILLVLFPALGVAVVAVRRRRLNRWHVAGLAIVAVVFLMGPYKARTFTRGVAFYYHVDHLSTPIKMTDEKGTVRWDVEHKHPFGDFGVQKATMRMSYYTGDSSDNRNYTVDNPLRFPGQYNDYNYRSLIITDGVGPYYNWNRWYSPQTGDYVEVEDPMLETETGTFLIVFNALVMSEYRGQQVNALFWTNGMGLPYVYAASDPVAGYDPDGRLAGVVAIVVAGAGAAGALWLAYDCMHRCRGACPVDPSTDLTGSKTRGWCINYCGKLAGLFGGTPTGFRGGATNVGKNIGGAVGGAAGGTGSGY